LRIVTLPAKCSQTQSSIIKHIAHSTEKITHKSPRKARNSLAFIYLLTYVEFLKPAEHFHLNR
jgi:hypothetical protein